LLGGGVEKTRKPREGNGDDATVGEPSAQHVLVELDADYALASPLALL
jgi:hypothetical protein